MTDDVDRQEKPSGGSCSMCGQFVQGSDTCYVCGGAVMPAPKGIWAVIQIIVLLIGLAVIGYIAWKQAGLL